MTTRRADRDASAATLMVNQSGLVFAGLLFGGYDLGGDVAEVIEVAAVAEIEATAAVAGASPDASGITADRHRVAAPAVAVDGLLTAA